MKIKWEYILLIIIFLIAFFYRLYGLSKNQPPFWVDEFASANQGKIFLKYGLSVFVNPKIFFEHYNITTHVLIASAYRLFGISELSARVPLVFIGSFLPVVVYLLAKKIFDIQTALSAALLTVFSYFEIVWSRQARGYIILQFLILLTFYLYLNLQNRKKVHLLSKVILIILIFLGMITHPLYYLFLLSVFVHFFFTNYSKALSWLKSLWFYLVFLVLIYVVSRIGFIDSLKNALSYKYFLTNNLWYYHSFLWREYGLIAFLGLVGIILGLKTKNKFILPVFIYSAVHIIFISFVFKPYVSRYLLPVFPFLFIGTTVALSEIARLLLNPLHNGRNIAVFTLLLTLFIIINGDKFVNKPKKYYSLNHDFREIANIDYQQIYNLIKNKGDLPNDKTVVIDTWWDRAKWYLGDEFKNIVAFRWYKDEGYVNGLSKKISFYNNGQGEKILTGSNLRLVLQESDLLRYIKEYPQGFLFIDDSSLPKDVRDYAENNLKKEIYLDHYPLDENPYSIWPATLYSWGVHPVTKNSGNGVK